MSKLKAFINNFNFEKPNWDTTPKNFPNCDLEGLSSNQVGQFNAIKNLWQINQPQQPQARSRVWQSPRGYRFLVQWTNAVLLRILIRKFTLTLPRGEHRTKTQLDDAARSVVSNIEEGYRRPTTQEYLNFLGYSEGSLEEIHGDTNKCLQDNFIKSIPNSSLKNIGLDLKAWNSWAQNPLNSTKLLYFPLIKNIGSYRTLKEIRGGDITFEILRELINKTDYLLRRLVQSLEKKLDKSRRGYQVEKARIHSHLK